MKRKFIKFKELTKKQKENRIISLIIGLTSYFIIFLLIAFKYSIPAIHSITDFTLKSLRYTLPNDPIQFIIFYGSVMLIGTLTPLILMASYYGKLFDYFFYKTKIDIGYKPNEN